MAAHTSSNHQLAEAVRAVGAGTDDFWSFRGKSVRRHVHDLFQYPAMMVPEVQGCLMDAVLKSDAAIETVVDPFMGAGTTMVEAMARGRDFVGFDINPLAVLVSRVKAGPHYTNSLAERTAQVLADIRRDRGMEVDVDFPGLQKWFHPQVAADLSRIRRAICGQEAAWARRFFWVALAATVRLTSNSRTSTFKLHIRPSSELAERVPDAIAVFREQAMRNQRLLSEHASELRREGSLVAGRYVGSVRILLGDSSAPHGATRCGMADLLMTSPPYGDNKSTVPYGQFSYLPLQWIDFADIAPDASPALLGTTHAIDTLSLGGVLSDTNARRAILEQRSSSFADYARSIEGLPPDRLKRICAFCGDLDAAVSASLRLLRPGGVMIWTVGNRCVGGRRVPLDHILQDLVTARGASLVILVRRQISGKRMAYRNSVSATMQGETVCVFRKVD